MPSTLDMVAEFSRTFGYPVNDEPGVPESVDSHCDGARWQIASSIRAVEREAKALSKATGDPCMLRLRLILEELRELADAMADHNAKGALDALCDIRYVCDGTTHLLGMGAVFDEAMRRVHASNMSKAGPDGKPIHDATGKLLKGPHYSPPDLTDLVAPKGTR